MNRCRRVIFNNDMTGDVFTPHPLPLSMPDLTDVVEQFDQTDVDTFVLQAALTDYCMHDTQIGEIMDNPKVRDLLARGIDPVAVICNRARELGLRFLVGIRMNDLHDLWPWCVKQPCKMKREHPEWLVGALRASCATDADGDGAAGAGKTMHSTANHLKKRITTPSVI